MPSRISPKPEVYFHPHDSRDARDIIDTSLYDPYKRQQKPPKGAWPDQVGKNCKCGCGRKARRIWFSDACSKWVVSNLYIFSGYSLRGHTGDRDNGVCSVCSLDTVKLEHLIASSGIRPKELKLCFYNEPPSFDDAEKNAVSNFIWSTRQHGWHLNDFFTSYDERQSFLQTRSLWDADHILPVKDGGGALGLTNMRTLCKACHRRRGKDNGEPFEMFFDFDLIGSIRFVHPVY